MRLRVNEAIAAAKLQGKDVKKKELAKLLFPKSTEMSRITLMTKVCSGMLERVNPEWIGIIANECGVDANFVLGIEQDKEIMSEQMTLFGESVPVPTIPEMQAIEPKELLPGLSVEEMKAIFFDKAALVEPSYRVYQLNSKGHRYYYRFDDFGEPAFYPSVTTILSQTLPKSPFLISWIADKGEEEAERYKMERAAYGTFMHAQFEDLLITRSYNLDMLKSRLKDYIDEKGLAADFVYYADELKKDVLAFAQFVIDYDVRPLAVEIALVSDKNHYAGMIDCPCTMKKKMGSEERINAIVDFKSGRKGFYEECEIQLHLYKMMWEENFPGKPIEKLFNFSPKDWRKKPSYNLKDQTESENAKKIPAILEIASIEDSKRDNTFTATSGEINLDQPGIDLSSNIISLTLSELIKKNN